jgi:hypothetical protein
VSEVAKTSIEAFHAIAEQAPSLMERVYAAIEAKGLRGATIDELVIETGILTQTVCPRVHSLREEGRIVRTSEPRKTRRNRKAFVLVASKFVPQDQLTMFGVTNDE